MWTTAEMKEKAKVKLRGSYWPLFWVTLLVTILSLDHYQMINRMNLLLRLFGYPAIAFAYDTQYWITVGIGLLLAIFVTDILNVGLCRIYLLNHGGQLKPGELFYGFRSGYLHIVWVQFSTSMIIILYTLLLIVPGIVAGYRYRMVPYLLSENPELSGREARELSSRMTDGEKASIFGLDLTFIGWFLLGILCFTLGTFFVQPYYNATCTELYLYLRDKTTALPDGAPQKGEETV